MVCVMEDNGNVAEVIDGGGQYIGQSVCSGFEASGCTEDTQAESQIREQERQAANAQASAAAAAQSRHPDTEDGSGSIPVLPTRPSRSAASFLTSQTGRGPFPASAPGGRRSSVQARALSIG